MTSVRLKLRLVVAILRGHAVTIEVGYVRGQQHIIQTFQAVEIVDRRDVRRIPDPAVHAQQN